MTLHKLWTKMCERDYRTIVKSLYILHSISRECSVDACQQFSSALKDMAKTRNPKKPDHRYFEVRVISDVDDASVQFEKYVRAYAAYVLHRSKSFTARFSELEAVVESLPKKAGAAGAAGGEDEDEDESEPAAAAPGLVSEKKAVGLIKKVQQAISLALLCTVPDSIANPITGYATKQMVLDLRDMWTLYSSLVTPFASATARAAAFKDPVASDEDVASFLRFYKDTETPVQEYLSKAVKNKVYAKLRIKMPKGGAVESQVDSEKLQQRIAALTSLSGGAVPSRARGAASALPAACGWGGRVTGLRGGAKRSVEESDEEESGEEEEEEEESEEDEDEDEEVVTDGSDDDEEEEEEEEEQDEDEEEEEEDEEEEEEEDAEETDEDEEDDEEDDEIAEEEEDEEEDEEEEDTTDEDEEDDDEEEEEEDSDDDE